MIGMFDAREMPVRAWTHAKTRARNASRGLVTMTEM
jgi:hypothetical protein